MVSVSGSIPSRELVRCQAPAADQQRATGQPSRRIIAVPRGLGHEGTVRLFAAGPASRHNAAYTVTSVRGHLPGQPERPGSQPSGRIRKRVPAWCMASSATGRRARPLPLRRAVHRWPASRRASPRTPSAAPTRPATHPPGQPAGGPRVPARGVPRRADPGKVWPDQACEPTTPCSTGKPQRRYGPRRHDWSGAPGPGGPAAHRRGFRRTRALAPPSPAR